MGDNVFWKLLSVCTKWIYRNPVCLYPMFDTNRVFIKLAYNIELLLKRR